MWEHFITKLFGAYVFTAKRSWEASVWANDECKLLKKKTWHTYMHRFLKVVNNNNTGIKYALVTKKMLFFCLFNWHHSKKLTFSDQHSHSCGLCWIGQSVNQQQQQQQQQRFTNPQMQRQRRETGRYELCCRIETLWDKHSYRKCKLDESPLLLLARIRTTHFR